MFTGIIEGIGKITLNTGSVLELLTSLNPIAKGDSVAVNGICLTATEITMSGKGFAVRFDYSSETSKLTTLCSLSAGQTVNLERALRADSRLGGHFVTGHIEGIGTLANNKTLDNSVILEFKVPQELFKYIVKKGSIAVDGISLTVTEASNESFSVAVIPFTLGNTTLSKLKKGGKVNIETDIMAKYAEKAVLAATENTITKEFLKENGYC
jgi:riboflavin synthase